MTAIRSHDIPVALPVKNASTEREVPLLGHLKPLPQSLSLEEARLQFQQNNRLASSRKAR